MSVTERPQETKSEYAGTVDQQYTQLLSKWETEDVELFNSIQSFETHVLKVYGEEAQHILTALRLSAVLHTKNEKPAKEGEVSPAYRRELYPGTNKNKYYISHPLAVASALAGLNREVQLDGINDKLPIRESPHGAEYVIAGLLHDVIEDVTYEGKSGEGLFDVIDNSLSAFPRYEIVKRIVNAVTKEDVSGFEEGTQKVLLEHPLYIAMQNQLINLLGNTSGTPEEAAISKLQQTIADMDKMFRIAFPNPDTKKEDDYKVFWGAFAVKLHDIESNLETEVRPDKLIRAHLYAVLARTMDYPVSSRLAAHLVADQHYKLFGAGVSSQDQIRIIAEYIEAERRKMSEGAGLMHIKHSAVSGQYNSFTIDSHQIPVFLASELKKRDNNGTDAAVPLQLQLRMPRHQIWLTNEVGYDIPVILDDTNLSAERIENSGFSIFGGIDRGVAYYHLVDENGKVIKILRIVDHHPFPYDALKKDSQTKVHSIPEYRYLRNYKGSLKSTLDILEYFSPFRAVSVSQ